jgi:hypothetical protein
MRVLSKSKLLAFRQCPKRLWLEVYRRDLNDDRSGSAAGFNAGKTVGEVARALYDPNGAGQRVDVSTLGIEQAYARSAELLQSAQPIFEAGFVGGGASAFADVLLPVEDGGALAWRMVEVKSASEIKEYHRDDAAIQSFVARQAKLPVLSISVATVDTNWAYLGGGDYRGLLVEEDLTAETAARNTEVRNWIAAAQAIVASRSEPLKSTGKHCVEPFDCGFLAYCRSREAAVEFPVTWLPNIRTKALKAHIATLRVTEMTQVPDEFLNDRQLRVKECTLSGEPFFDATGAVEELAKHGYPAFFLDFETIGFAVPIWPGTRPYQSLTFQFSVHRVAASGEIEHREFLDLSGDDPRAALAGALVTACETEGPIYVYSSFERSRIRDLIRDVPALSLPFEALIERLVDLRPIAEKYYYHPSQEGSWSIKKVFAALSGRSYDELGGIQDGGMAMEAYVEAIAAATPDARRAEIDSQLRAYCALDTEAMICVWERFGGRK